MNARWVLVPLLLLAPAVRAGAFDPRHVPAAAPWVVHVDLEALSGSTILRALHADGVRFENEFDLDHLQSDFGLSPFGDLRSLTLYGSGRNGEESVCVAIGTSALATAKARLSANGARAVKVGGIDALQIEQRGATRFLALLSADSGSTRVALVAPTEAALNAALLAWQNEAPTLANPGVAASPKTSPPRIHVRPKKGSLVFAASTPVASFEDNATYLQRALSLLCEFADASEEEETLLGLGTRALEFEFTEHRDEIRLELAIDAHTGSKAKELEAALRGAMTRAARETDSADVAVRVATLLGALRFETLGTRLKASFRYAPKRFVDDIRFVEEARGIRPRN